MKKLMAFLCSVLAVLFMNVALLGTAEAARVAVIPIDVDVKVERAGDFNSYYWDMLIDRFRYPDYELLDDDKVAAVVPETGLKTFEKAALSAVAEKVSAEIVVAMRITDVQEIPKSFMREPMVHKSFMREPMVQCIMSGEFASFNRLTGNYYYKKINYSKDIHEIWTVRNDWQQEVFADYLRRGINRTLEDKRNK